MNIYKFIINLSFILSIYWPSQSVMANQTSATTAISSNYLKISKNINESCKRYYNSKISMKTGFYNSIVTSLKKPEKGYFFLDTEYNTCISRVTDHEREPPVGFARNDYSRRQAFNANDTMILIYARDGYWHIYDANTLKYVKKLNLGGGSTEPQWHPTEPDTLYIIPNNGGMSIISYNVRTDKSLTVADFNSVSKIYNYPDITDIKEIFPEAVHISSKSEGSPSADGRYWGLQIDDSTWRGLGAITYDILTNTITGVYDFNKHNIGKPDHVSMSPSGKYIVISWHTDKCKSDWIWDLGTLDKPCGLMSFNRNFTSAIGLSKLGPHSDIAIDSNGEDVVVISNYNSGYVESINLSTGKKINLWNMYINGSSTAMHFSGKSYNRPGWILISTYQTTKDNQWYTNKILAVEISSSPQIIQLANNRVIYKGYWTAPVATVNRNFTKVLFNSNWDSDNEDVDTYLITLPQHFLKYD